MPQQGTEPLVLGRDLDQIEIACQPSNLLDRRSQIRPRRRGSALLTAGRLNVPSEALIRLCDCYLDRRRGRLTYA
jgi:hypothetical protein